MPTANYKYHKSPKIPGVDICKKDISYARFQHSFASAAGLVARPGTRSYSDFSRWQHLPSIPNYLLTVTAYRDNQFCFAPHTQPQSSLNNNAAVPTRPIGPPVPPCPRACPLRDLPLRARDLSRHALAQRRVLIVRAWRRGAPAPDVAPLLRGMWRRAGGAVLRVGGGGPVLGVRRGRLSRQCGGTQCARGGAGGDARLARRGEREKRRGSGDGGGDGGV